MALARIAAPDPTSPIDVAGFTAGIAGSVVRPEDESYETARLVHNRNVDRYPSLIVKAANATDVARTVVFARDSGLELAIRGGSHSLAGYGTTDGGIVLDLSGMKGLHIDPERRLAWAQAGLTAGEYTVAAAAHGLATPFGDTGSVGISGLTLGGGIGWLARKYGLAIDALVSVEIVTADGRVITANENEHTELFWAVRGGGGNFGVVTRFQFRLYPVGMIFGGALFMPPTREVLRSLGPIAASAPEELTTISILMAAPPAPFIPAELHGKPTLAIMFVYDGDAEAGQAAIEPFRQVATPIAELVMPMPYPGIYELLKDAETPGRGAHRSLFLDALDDTAIDTILEHTAAASSPATMTQIRILGGAMARVPAGDTAFAHRDAPVMVVILTPFEDPAEAPIHQAFTEAYFEALRPGSTGVYANFLEAEGEARVHEAYPDLTYRRLAQVKRTYDPANLFRLNQNIRPAAEA
ncbi:MAG TPA: FAD-binding oxidoreductase [Methylomirabilota bacterium]|nr:FAD-binding oxidoreductase [Methylomirabilota bacterium]